MWSQDLQHNLKYEGTTQYRIITSSLQTGEASPLEHSGMMCSSLPESAYSVWWEQDASFGSPVSSLHELPSFSSWAATGHGTRLQPLTLDGFSSPRHFLHAEKRYKDYFGYCLVLICIYYHDYVVTHLGSTMCSQTGLVPLLIPVRAISPAGMQKICRNCFPSEPQDFVQYSHLSTNHL